MANGFDPDRFIKQNEDSLADVDKGESSGAFDAEAFIAKHSDPASGNVRAPLADGLAPETPINSSPVSATDRLKLSFGNRAGRLNFLKERYEDAQVTPGGEFVVKDKGLWHRVDPDNLGDGDAWARTKEAVKDIADLSDVASSFLGAEVGALGGAILGAGAGGLAAGIPGLGVGATVGAIGGAGAGAAAAAKANSSLGRLFGTYEATPENELENMSMEMMLNMGGQALPPGVKLTGRGMGAALKKAAPTFSKMSNTTKELVASTFGATSGAGGEAALRMMNRPDEIAATLNRFSKGADSNAAINAMKSRSIDATKQMVNQSRAALSGFYRKGLENIGNQLPANISSPVRPAVDDMFKIAQEQGLGTISNGKFALKSREQLVREGQKAGVVPEFARDENAYKMLREFFAQSNLQAGAKQLRGQRAAFKQMTDADQSIRGLAGQLEKEATEAGLNQTKQAIQQLRNTFNKSLDDRFRAQIPSAEGKIAYANLKDQYAKTATAMQPLFDAQRAAIRKRSDVPYEQLLTKMTAKGARQQATKDATIAAIETLGDQAPGIAKLNNEIADLDTASKFVPFIRESFIQFGVASVLFDVATGGTGTIAKTALGTSPRATGAALRGAARASKAPQQLVNQGRAGMAFLRNRTPEEVSTMMSDDEVAARFIRSIINVPEIDMAGEGQ